MSERRVNSAMQNLRNKVVEDILENKDSVRERIQEYAESSQGDYDSGSSFDKALSFSKSIPHREHTKVVGKVSDRYSRKVG